MNFPHNERTTRQREFYNANYNCNHGSARDERELERTVALIPISIAIGTYSQLTPLESYTVSKSEGRERKKHVLSALQSIARTSSYRDAATGEEICVPLQNAPSEHKASNSIVVVGLPGAEDGRADERRARREDVGGVGCDESPDEGGVQPVLEEDKHLVEAPPQAQP